MWRQVVLLVWLWHLPAAASGTAGTAAEPATLQALERLVPAHHPLRSSSREPIWFEYREPPAVGYMQPDFDSWAETLDALDETRHGAVGDGEARFVAIWRDPGGQIRHVLARGEHTRLFSLDGDTIEFEDPGFHTQVGVARWGWVYGDGLLRTHRTWRLAFGPPDKAGRPTGPLAPTTLYAVTTYEYRPGRAVPSRSRTFWSEEDRLAGRWGQKTTYGPDGRHLRTRHNPERPYPY